MNQLQWSIKKMDELTVTELYNILKLRSEVFVVEQNCVYLDTDNKDLQSFHLCGWLKDNLMAYARILPPGLSYPEASIGRVCTAFSVRKNGYGQILMQHAINETYSLFTCSSIKIGAQLYLHSFYKSLGFNQISEPYMEDGIPHIEMLHSK
jgi:ElaA protein